MVKIAIFDSGLGSLSIIKPIQKKLKSDILYFADQKNFPYGKKRKSDLKKIIKKTIGFITSSFDPDLIIIASNTPSLLFEEIFSKKVIGVFPPLKKAQQMSKTKNVALLVTKNVALSKELGRFIEKNVKSDIAVHKVNASNLIDLVESGKFLTDIRYCNEIIKQELKILDQKNIDVATLSSTHLPFLKRMIEKQFPNIVFLDPAQDLANEISKMGFKRSKKNSLQIFSSGNTRNFEKQLKMLKIKTKVSHFE